jgi:hypothetical protein
MAKKNYYLEVIQQAVVNNDFEFDANNSIMEVFQQAFDSLMENPTGQQFIHTDLDCHGMTQNYTFYDEVTDFENHVSGEVFDFRWHYKADDEVLFHEVRPGEFEPVNWFDVPMEGEEGRNDYIFVFDREILSDGRVAYLYDYFA